MRDIHIFQSLAYLHYNSPQYVNGSDPVALPLKKLCPWNMFLLNTYDLELSNVKLSSFSYLLSKEITLLSYPFRIQYDTTVPYYRLVLNNVVLEDIALEDQNLFTIQNMDLTSIDRDNM